ncbi:hypothetical protein, partial [Chitinophaga sp. 22620]|uniref:hypothetical protein n=1 Tax=Chitinophaga sp. 22620 TaxID=3453952 RepID=UPI003F86E0C2
LGIHHAPLFALKILNHLALACFTTCFPNMSKNFFPSPPHNYYDMVTLRSMMKNLDSVVIRSPAGPLTATPFSFVVVLPAASASNKTFKNLETTATV